MERFSSVEIEVLLLKLFRDRDNVTDEELQKMIKYARREFLGQPMSMKTVWALDSINEDTDLREIIYAAIINTIKMDVFRSEGE